MYLGSLVPSDMMIRYPKLNNMILGLTSAEFVTGQQNIRDWIDSKLCKIKLNKYFTKTPLFPVFDGLNNLIC